MSQAAIITGGAGGIGSPICRALAQDGLKIVAADFAGETGESLAEDTIKGGGDAVFQKVDVGERASVEQMVEKALAGYSRIAVSMNAAGVISRAPDQKMTEGE